VVRTLIESTRQYRARFPTTIPSGWLVADMASRAPKQRKRATNVKYVISIRDSASVDVVQKISDAHARALLADKAEPYSVLPKEKSLNVD